MENPAPFRERLILRGPRLRLRLRDGPVAAVCPQVLFPDTYVIRKFHSTICPSDNADELNGWIIMRHHFTNSDSYPSQVFCSLGTGNAGPAGMPPRFYAPQCGGPPGQQDAFKLYPPARF